MIIRKTRDGSYWINDQRASSGDIVGVVGSCGGTAVSHFEADTCAGVFNAFCVSSTGEVDQVYSPESAAYAMSIASSAGDIIAARDARLRAEAEAANEAAKQAELSRPAQERRAARYRTEADPYVLAYLGYQIEIEAGAKSEAKRDAAKAAYLAVKAKIRDEIKDVTP